MATASGSRRRPKGAAAVTLFLSLSMALVGLSGGNALAGTRGKLSEAVDKSKKDDSAPVPFGSQTKAKEDVGAPEVHSEPEDDPVLVAAVYAPDDRPLPPVYGPQCESAYGGAATERPPFRLFFTLAGGASGGEALTRAKSAGLSVGFSPMPGLRFDVTGRFGAPAFAPARGLSGAFASIYDAGAGLEGRVYALMDSSFRGVYVLAGYRYSRLQWEYESPFFVEEPDGSFAHITGDRVESHSYYGGLGVTLLGTSTFQIGANVSGGWRSFAETTYERFENDVFQNGMFVQARLELTFVTPEL